LADATIEPERPRRERAHERPTSFSCERKVPEPQPQEALGSLTAVKNTKRKK
jgi:hypothetical protein